MIKITTMKLSFFCMLILILSGYSGAGQNKTVYDVTIKSLEQRVIALSDDRSKKIIVSVFDASNPDKDQLRLLDKIYKNSNGQVAVIAIPLSDFGIPRPLAELKSILRDSLNLSFEVSDISRGKAGPNQNVLIKWLTSKNLNNHFDLDVNVPGEIYFISDSGFFYATLRRKLYQSEQSLIQVLNLQVHE